MMRKPNSAIAMHLVLASLLTLFAIGVAIVLNSMRTTVRISAELKIKADYEMESALIMQYQKIKYNTNIVADSLSIPSQIIAPGLTLSVVTNKISSNTYQIKSQVSGKDFYKSISAKVYNPSLASPTINSPNTWKIVYIKPDR